MSKQSGMSIQILSEGQRIERASELADEKSRIKAEVTQLMRDFPRYEPDRTMFIRNLVNKALAGKVSEAAFKEFVSKTGSWDDVAKILPRAKMVQRNPISESDAQWFQLAMRTLGMERMLFRFDDSKKKWPDIWITESDLPVITVTQEWARQDTDERRKRLTHEILHYFGFVHGIINGMSFNTRPEKDELSKWFYNKYLK